MVIGIFTPQKKHQHQHQHQHQTPANTVCQTNITCERSRASGTTRPTLKTVHFTTPFSSAWPLNILHFGKLDDAVQCFSICAHLSPARDSACERSYGCPKSEGDAPKSTCHPGFVENCHLSKFPKNSAEGREIKKYQRATYSIAAHVTCTAVGTVMELRMYCQRCYVRYVLRTASTATTPRELRMGVCSLQHRMAQNA